MEKIETNEILNLEHIVFEEISVITCNLVKKLSKDAE